MDDDRIVEKQASAAGWALFSGCEGEEPKLVAFFVGAEGRALAEEVAEIRADGELVVFDPGIAPAVLLSEPDERGGVFAAKHYDDAQGIAALASAFRMDPADWLEGTPAAADGPASGREAVTTREPWGPAR